MLQRLYRKQIFKIKIVPKDENLRLHRLDGVTENYNLQFKPQNIVDYKKKQLYITDDYYNRFCNTKKVQKAVNQIQRKNQFKSDEILIQNKSTMKTNS